MDSDAGHRDDDRLRYYARKLQRHPAYRAVQVALRSARQFVPQAFRLATSRYRKLPSAVIVGSQKAGTTQLYSYLLEHPRCFGGVAKGAANAGSPFWSNTFVVFEKAKQPQAYVDFLIWLLGPKNADVHKAIIESGKAPTLNSVYKSQVETNPVFKWMALHRDMIATAPRLGSGKASLPRYSGFNRSSSDLGALSGLMMLLL